MKKIIILIVFLGLVLAINAQNENNQFHVGDGSTIALSVIMSEQGDNIPGNAISYLENKLKQIVAVNGLAVNDDFGRFIITASVFVVSKDILAGPPTRISMNMDVTLYIADYFDQKVFASQTISISGVGESETQAYNRAINKIEARNTQLADFIHKGKKNIVDYYTVQCDNVIKNAYSFAFQKQYEKAIFVLTSMPDAIPCYDKSLEATRTIYQQYLDYMCDVNLAKAKAVWASQQNSNGAAAAGSFLQYIYPDAKCYSEAEKLYAEIKGKVLDDWHFEMKKWDDNIDLESQRINAWKAVGTAYGNGQQPTTNIMPWLSR